MTGKVDTFTYLKSVTFEFLLTLITRNKEYEIPYSYVTHERCVPCCGDHIYIKLGRVIKNQITWLRNPNRVLVKECKFIIEDAIVKRRKERLE